MVLRLGDIGIERVEESCAPAVTPDEFLAGLPADAIERNAGWLVPSAFDPTSGRLVMSVHSWIVRTCHHTVLIDTCIGNGKCRPGMPSADRLDLPWLERLAAKGLTPESIDYVMCTHLHVDHVGWNTRLRDGRWVPTFPNARYLFARREFERWNPQGRPADGQGQDAVFNDSVLPCVEAGLVTLVEDGYTLDDELTVEAAPGHTTGHTIIRAKSGERTGLFTGDCMHTPLQVAYPDVNSVTCEDPVAAKHTRRKVLSEAAERGHLLLPAHFPPPFVGTVSERGDRFEYHPMSW